MGNATWRGRRVIIIFTFDDASVAPVARLAMLGRLLLQFNSTALGILLRRVFSAILCAYVFLLVVCCELRLW